MLNTRPKLAKAIQNGAIVMWFPTYIMDLRQGETMYTKENVAIEIRRAFRSNWRYYFFLSPLILLPSPLARLDFALVRLTRKLFRAVLI
jgi:hypothetical protein